MTQHPHPANHAETWNAQQRIYQTWDDYYRGRHHLKLASTNFTNRYQQTLLENTVLSIRENMCPAAVNAFTDGIEIRSWGDENAAAIADQHGLTRLEGLINRSGFRTGNAYAVTWPDTDPQPIFLNPAEIVPEIDTSRPSQLAACYRYWITSDDVAHCTIWTATHMHQWRSQSKTDGGRIPEAAAYWVPEHAKTNAVPHSFGVVPVVWWKRDPDSHIDHGHSILTDVIPLQDAMNKSLADLIITTETFSRPLLYLLNHQPDPGSYTNPWTNTPTPTATGGDNASQLATWDQQTRQIFATGGPGPFGRLDPPDLTPLLQIQDAFAHKIARVVGAPSYYFSQTSGDVPSGESLRILSSRRTATIRAWQRDATPVWRGLLQLLGVEDPHLEWADPMPLDATERHHLAGMKKQLGFALSDVIASLDEADPEGVLERATAAEEEARMSAETLGKHFRAGDIAY